MTTPTSATERRLRDLEMRLLKPETRSSRAELESLLDGEFVEFAQSGRVYDKQTALTALTAEAARDGTATPRAIEDFTARELAPGVVLLTYLVVGHAGESLRSSVWTQRDGTWRIVFHQGTPRALGTR